MTRSKNHTYPYWQHVSANLMKDRALYTTILLLFSTLCWGQEYSREGNCYSPDGLSSVITIFDGTYSSFYLKAQNDSILILATYSRYNPYIKWIDNTYVELKVPNSSFGYDSYVYDSKERSISCPHSLAVTIDVDIKRVVCVGIKEIQVKKLMTDEVLFEIEPKFLNPMGFVNSVDWEIVLRENLMILKYKDINNQIIENEINLR